jgi:hypothetical protein
MGDAQLRKLMQDRRSFGIWYGRMAEVAKKLISKKTNAFQGVKYEPVNVPDPMDVLDLTVERILDCQNKKFEKNTPTVEQSRSNVFSPDAW